MLTGLLLACASNEVSMAIESDGEATAETSILSLTTLSGETLDLADYRGQVVLVNFWATWGAPCCLAARSRRRASR
jgi:thiol-disulfide isomerase/thioredoxin